MFRKLLFPTDFSDTSRKAQTYVKQLRGAGTEEVIVLHVVDQRDVDALGKATGLSQDVQQQAENAAREEMTAVERDLKQAGLLVEKILAVGRPIREILDLAEREKVSLIVLGSHGRSNFSDIILGSTSENVIRHSRVPVLVVSRETVPG
jgi:nucleotide-binding universal stress UspA family protein